VRLQRLVERGIMTRSGAEARPAYQLTERGNELLPAMVALMQWGDKWASHNAPPVAVTDDKGRPLAAVKLKSSGGDVGVKTVRFRPGPGANARTRAFFSELALAEGSAVVAAKSR